MQAGDIVAAIDLGTSRTAYAYTVVGREHIWLGVPDSPDDDRNVRTGCSRDGTRPPKELGCDRILQARVSLYCRALGL